MKKRLLPVGYKFEFTNIIAGFICILGVFVFLLIVNNTSHPIEISIWSKWAVPIISFGIILIAVDLVRMRKIRILRKDRDIMMKKPPVKGEIIDIKQSQINWRGQFVSNMDGRIRYVYQLVVSYIDTVDGKKKTAESEYYRENLFTCLSDNQVDVYIYGDNGYVIVDGLHVRKFGENRIDIENKEPSFYDSDISFYIDIYGWVIIPIAVILIIVVVLFIFHFTPYYIKSH